MGQQSLYVAAPQGATSGLGSSPLLDASLPISHLDGPSSIQHLSDPPTCYHTRAGIQLTWFNYRVNEAIFLSKLLFVFLDAIDDIAGLAWFS
jgi:hypothetical protein